MKDHLKVSVITTTYNDAEHLRTIMEQVLRQSYPDIEYIVVDGASKDHTISVIQEMEPRFGGRLRWISEPDRGIYDAINKGIRMATGDIVGCCFDYFTSEHVNGKERTVFTRIWCTRTRTVWCGPGGRDRERSALDGCRDIRPCI